MSQALDTFRRINPAARLGNYDRSEKDTQADILFASIQTIGQKKSPRSFQPTAFDYIVIDEFHHGAAPSYRRLLDHFEPKFMLGLTATPERADGGDLLALCRRTLYIGATSAKGSVAGNLSVPAILAFLTTWTTETFHGVVLVSMKRR